MAYADVYLMPIPKKNVAAYKKMAARGCRSMMKLGALAYVETVAEELKLPWSTVPFDRLAKCKPGETVIVAWVLFKSKAHRNQVNKKFYEEAAKAPAPKKFPFDTKRVSVGGFKALVAA